MYCIEQEMSRIFYIYFEIALSIRGTADCVRLIRENRPGAPAYHPSTLMKLYLYGYLNGIRSSRKLENESKRNIELMWLLKK